jgi:hypothetical protein
MSTISTGGTGRLQCDFNKKIKMPKQLTLTQFLQHSQILHMKQLCDDL